MNASTTKGDRANAEAAERTLEENERLERMVDILQAECERQEVARRLAEQENERLKSKLETAQRWTFATIRLAAASTEAELIARQIYSLARTRGDEELRRLAGLLVSVLRGEHYRRRRVTRR